MSRCVCAISLLVLAGCRSAAPTPPEFADGVQEMLPPLGDQPWAGPSERARLRSDEPKFDFSSTAFDTSWSWDGGSAFVDPFRVARRADRAMGRSPARVNTDGLKTVYEYDETCTIVCVNPVIVLIEPRPSETAKPAGEISKGPIDGLVNIGPGTVKLPHAYKAGTSVSSIDGLRYFAPGKTETPEPVEADDEGVASIDVPWGKLEVRPAMFGYRVRAVQTQ